MTLRFGRRLFRVRMKPHPSGRRRFDLRSARGQTGQDFRNQSGGLLTIRKAEEGRHNAPLKLRRQLSGDAKHSQNFPLHHRAKLLGHARSLPLPVGVLLPQLQKLLLLVPPAFGKAKRVPRGTDYLFVGHIRNTTITGQQFQVEAGAGSQLLLLRHQRRSETSS